MRSTEELQAELTNLGKTTEDATMGVGSASPILVQARLAWVCADLLEHVQQLYRLVNELTEPSTGNQKNTAVVPTPVGKQRR